MYVRYNCFEISMAYCFKTVAYEIDADYRVGCADKEDQRKGAILAQ